MSSRRRFLQGLFHSLAAERIPYCVLRNYDNVYADDTTDVDLLVHKRDLPRFKERLRAAATAAGLRFVHRARYVNYSYVFWDAQGGFIRIDFETELRWRFLPVLSSTTVLSERQLLGDFYAPHPRHESVILFLQGVWRGSLSERYRRQLARLYTRCDSDELLRTLRQAFGGAGGRLAEIQANILDAKFDAGESASVKGSLIRKLLWRPSALTDLAAHTFQDAGRLWERLRHPAGISLLYASSADADAGFSDLVRKLEFLFPAQKCFIQTIDLTGTENVAPGWEVWLKLRRLRTLFKGGLFVRYYRLSKDTDLRKVIRTHPRVLYPSRAFFCMQDSGRRLCLAHVSSGCMTDSNGADASGAGSFSTLLIEFISTMLEKERRPDEFRVAGRGVFVVLIGLDGSGKTTLARNLARLATVDPRFDGVRYYHWRPRIFKTAEFPLPDYRETPRKTPLPRTWFNSVISSLRLFKNVALANAASWFRIRPQLRRNRLVMIDRYFYNYELDPASVKYAGPRWLLNRMLPWYPRPDVVLTLEADAATLLSRKRELSPEEIARQIEVIGRLDWRGARHVKLDATQPAAAVAASALAGITGPPPVSEPSNRE